MFSSEQMAERSCLPGIIPNERVEASELSGLRVSRATDGLARRRSTRSM
jgi:hypothetical protein